MSTVFLIVIALAPFLVIFVTLLLHLVAYRKRSVGYFSLSERKNLESLLKDSAEPLVVIFSGVVLLVIQFDITAFLGAFVTTIGYIWLFNRLGFFSGVSQRPEL